MEELNLLLSFVGTEVFWEDLIGYSLSGVEKALCLTILPAVGRVPQTKIRLLYQKEDRHPNKLANTPSKRGFHKWKENLPESEWSEGKPGCTVKGACLLWELLKSSCKLVCSLFRVGMSADG